MPTTTATGVVTDEYEQVRKTVLAMVLDIARTAADEMLDADVKPPVSDSIRQTVVQAIVKRVAVELPEKHRTPEMAAELAAHALAQFDCYCERLLS